MHIRLITFGAGGQKYVASAKRIAKHARDFPQIDQAIAYTDTDLDDGYSALFPDFPKRYPRGFGLWSWKPYLIARELEELSDGDILIYVDGGCELNAAAQSRFADYLQWTQDHGALLFQVAHPNKHFTKNDPRLLPDETFGEQGQIAATVLMVQKNQRMIAFVDKWLAMCAEDDGELLKDVDPITQKPEFVDHRHDQSVLNAAAYAHDLACMPDETYLGEPHPLRLRRFAKQAMALPILAMRNRSGVSFMPLVRFFAKL